MSTFPILKHPRHRSRLLFIFTAEGEFFLFYLRQLFHVSASYDAGNISVYPVEDFIKASDYGLVAVQIQYRVGLFGALAQSDLQWKLRDSQDFYRDKRSKMEATSIQDYVSLHSLKSHSSSRLMILM